MTPDALAPLLLPDIGGRQRHDQGATGYRGRWYFLLDPYG